MCCKYSIIVPAYNVQGYIIDCLESLDRINYDKNRYEVVVVNDGSTDQTLQRIEDWIKDKSNFRLISQDNKGLGGARNTGITFSKGEWLLFIDSDDWIHDPDVLNVFDSYLDKDIEIIKSISYRETFTRDSSSSFHYKNAFIDSGSGADILLSDNFKPHVWLGCYKSSLIKKAEYRFREKIAYEDLDWSIVMHLNALKVTVIDYKFCSYFYNTDSLSNNPSLKRIRDMIASLISVQNITQNKNIPPLVSEIIKKRLKKNTIRLVLATRNYKILDSVKLFKEARNIGLFDTIKYKSTIIEKIIYNIYIYFPLIPISAIRTATLINRWGLNVKK